MNVPRWKLIAALAVLYFGWGGAYLAARFTIETIPPLLSSGAGFATAGSILWLGSQRGRPWPSLADWRKAVILGALMILGGIGGTIWAQQRVVSGLAALVVSAEPVWMVLYEWVFERRRPDLPILIGLSLGLIGLAYLAVPDTGELDRLGFIALFIATIFWVAGALMSRKLKMDINENQSTGLYMLVGGLELCLASACIGEWSRFHWSHIAARSALAWSYNTFFSSLVGFTAYLWLLRVTRVSLVSTYAFVNPVVALLLGWWLAGERLSWHTGISSLLLIAGVTVITLAQTWKTPRTQII